MKEVAKRAGVAMSSVSRVLSGHPDVSEPMRQRVMTAVDELGYQPDLLAQGLRSRTTYSVGFVVANIANPVLAGAIRGAERRLRAAGYSLLLTDSEGSPVLDAAQIELLQRRRVDGLLLSLSDEQDTQTAAAIRALDEPIVLMDRDLPPGISAPRALFDHRKGMRQAARHLLELGHRDVALIIGGPFRPAHERRAGLEATLRRGGARCAVFEGEFSVKHGYATTVEILNRVPRPTAIVAGGNMLMHGALRALVEADVQLGQDISFVGCDDTAVAEFHRPAIAVVHRDVEAIGEAGAELLLDALDERRDRKMKDVTLPTKFIDRPSCAPPPRRSRRAKNRSGGDPALSR
jgi:LacI family transcriptional regulator